MRHSESVQTAAGRLPAHVARYARAFRAAAGQRHHVGSPLGAWILLALCAPAAAGAEAGVLTGLVGCDARSAARAAADLLADPHRWWAPPWPRRSLPGTVSPGWLAGLPETAARGDVPVQAELDRWAREHTLGLIDRFPLLRSRDTHLILASALATRVSWQQPSGLAAAAELGRSSPWAGRVDRVLRAPDGGAHRAFIAGTETGDVAVHTAAARDGLLVTSVIAAPAIAAADVLAVAHQLAIAAVAGQTRDRRSLYDLPLGDGPAWTVREESSSRAGTELCTAVLPAWSAHSPHELADPALGFRPPSAPSPRRVARRRPGRLPRPATPAPGPRRPR